MAARLGDILVEAGEISQEDLDKALAFKKEEDEKADIQGKPHRRLGEVLINMGLTTDMNIARVLAMQMHTEAVDLSSAVIGDDLLDLLDVDFMRKHCCVPIEFEDGVLKLAMADPFDLKAIDDAPLIMMNRNPNLSKPLVESVIAPEMQINVILDRRFGNAEAEYAASAFADEQKKKAQKEAEEGQKEEEDVSNAPIVAYVRSVLERAATSRTSDIHIDALEREIHIRFRIDGVLRLIETQPISMLPAISTRIKIMSGLDISEKRKPQDGRITINVAHTEYDIRVAILPTSYGEKIVMRLAKAQALIADKASLGIRPYELKKFDRILSRPNGIILVTGPTGSGKSTTLYTALSQLNTQEVNIMTVEDPVEANIPGINQVQVNVKAGLTFASALRSFLRQDPDIIMLGEIRDAETAGIAVQASITGHLVVSTLHTNSSAASVTRLEDMGIPAYLLADSLTGIIAQRLVRKLCPDCKRWRKAAESEITTIGLAHPEKYVSHLPAGSRLLKEGTEDEEEVLEEDTDLPGVYVCDPVGCAHCNETGYAGRKGIYEVMEMTPVLRDIVAKAESTSILEAKAKEQGLRTLHDNAAVYVLDGTTSMAEMNKVTINVAAEESEEEEELKKMREEEKAMGII